MAALTYATEYPLWKEGLWLEESWKCSELHLSSLFLQIPRVLA